MKQENTGKGLTKEKEDILITKENLLEEIGTMLKDEFVASTKAVSDGIELQFLTGQTFVVSVR